VDPFFLIKERLGDECAGGEPSSWSLMGELAGGPGRLRAEWIAGGGPVMRLAGCKHWPPSEACIRAAIEAL